MICNFEELRVNVVLLRQSIAALTVCLRAPCDRGLLFALRSFLSFVRFAL